ncbi:MAG: sulfatase-like hydrolase/transferase [Pseudomonadota bacterium]
MAERPNFLFFVTDQQRADHYGFAGNAQIRTPNLDRLANQGSWWTRCYTASPSCMSNRASLMTGRMPSLHGVRFNGIPLDRDSVTFVDLLRDAGYQTTLIGKSHLQGQSSEKSHAPQISVDPNKHQPSLELSEAKRSRFGPDDYLSERIQLWKNADAPLETPRPYYGFDTVEFCLGHGDKVAGHYLHWLEEKKRAGFTLEETAPALDVPQLYKPTIPAELYPTTFVAERTCDLLSEYAHSSKPFFIQCSFPDPHHPFTPPGKYWDMFDPESITLPSTFKPPSQDAIPPLKHIWQQFESGHAPERFSHQFVASKAQAREITAKTFGQIAMVDDAMGQVLARLEDLNLASNTVVCFITDHGDYLGDHGLFLKGPFQYQSLIRTPFVWLDPLQNHNQGQREALASTLDVPATILSRAGLQPYNGMQGIDLLAQDVSQRDYALVEHTNQFVYLGFDDILSVHTYVDHRWRLSVWQGQPWGELYDLESDPQEQENLWACARHAKLKSELLVKLIHGIQDHGETSPAPSTVS